jgi:lipoate-protein ligase A
VRIERVSGPAGAVLDRGLPDPLPSALAVLVRPERPTLVLGSRQRPDAVDEAAAERAGVDVVRRFSGGGAVLLEPGRSIWIDVLLPPTDRRWVDDVGVSFRWLGELWAAALRGLGVPAAVRGGRLERTPWGELVCFGALGPGEVTVGGRKVVGMSQRRNRAGARFQCLVHDSWRPAALLRLLALPAADRAAAEADLRDRAAGPGVPLADLERAVLARLGGDEGAAS